MDDLVKRLRKQRVVYAANSYVRREPVNPDGPEAADLIETQAARLASVDASRTEGNDKLARVAEEAAAKIYTGDGHAG